jgi:hypothetical protein
MREAYTKEIAAARSAVDEAKKDFENRQSTLNDLYVKILQEKGYDPMDLIVTGTWGCKNSPVETCVYHFFEDPCHDHCIFCGNPEERK